VAFTEFKVDGDCVIDADGGIVYDGLSPRAAAIIAELLTWRSMDIAEREWIPIETAPPIQRFISGRGRQPPEPPYVLAVDAKGRMSVGYAREHSEGFTWTFAKPIGQPTHWMALPAPPA
jgi:hypothetical protein